MTEPFPDSPPPRLTFRPAAAAERQEDLSFEPARRFVQRHRRLIAYTLGAAVLAALAWSFLKPRQYTSTASFVLQMRTPTSGLTALASQFGLGALANADPGKSPAFFADLLTSRRLLDTLAKTRFQVRDDRGTRTVILPDVLKASGDTPAQRIEKTEKKFSKRLTVKLNAKTGVITIAVTLPAPDLAQQVTAMMLDQVNTFNLDTRRTQAGAERRFTEQRLDAIRSELRVAEDRAKEFLQSNRAYQRSPDLSFLHDRLDREVSLKQQVYTTLSQAVEQSRIDEVRDTPAISIVEPPRLPAKADDRDVPLALAASLALGMLVAVGAGMFLDWKKRPSKDLAVG